MFLCDTKQVAPAHASFRSRASPQARLTLLNCSAVDSSFYVSDVGSLSPPVLPAESRALSQPAQQALCLLLGRSGNFLEAQDGSPAGQRRLAAGGPCGAGERLPRRSLPLPVQHAC